MNRKSYTFLNCTAHSLTEDQIKMIFEIQNNCNTVELKSENPNLHNELINCPPDEEKMLILYNQFSKYLLSYLKANKKTKFYIHLPIGSPYFMALFFSRFPVKKRIEFLFSHTDRESIEEIQEDGRVIKKSVFRFQKFLTLKRNSLR